MQSVQAQVEGFLFHCQYEKNLSDKTIKAYRIDLQQFLLFLSDRCMDRIESVDKQVLRDYIKLLADFKPKTTKRKLATLKALFNYAEYEEVIVINPFRKLKICIKEEKSLPKTIPIPNIARLFGSVYSQKDLLGLKTAAPNRRVTRDIAVLELLYSAGIRVSELCHLRPDCVDLQRGCVKIMGKGRRERLVPLCGREEVRALATYAELYRKEIQSTEWFFINRDGRRLSEQSVRLMIRKYVQKAQFVEHITPHMFRHSVATQLLENGVDIRYIQTFLGHSSITTTQIYAQVTEESQRQVIAGKHPRREFGREPRP